MKALLCPSAYVDFYYPESLSVVAGILSEQIFGGINFIGENTGIWDEVPAVRLSKRFLGLNIELGGEKGTYTLQIEAPDFPWELISSAFHATASTDLSGFVQHMLSQICDIKIKE